MALHPTIPDGMKMIIKQNGKYYLTLLDQLHPISNEMNEELKLVVGSLCLLVYDTNLTSILSNDKINAETKEAESKSITDKIVAWKRWIIGGNTWKLFCARHPEYSKDEAVDELLQKAKTTKKTTKKKN